MFFGCKKAGKIYWALRNQGVASGKASRLTLLAWFTVLDSSVATILDFSRAKRRGELVLALYAGASCGPCTCKGYDLFKSAWNGLPLKKRYDEDGPCALTEKNSFATFEDVRGETVGIPEGTLVRVKEGVFLGLL